MSLTTKEKLHQFFLGENAVWDEIADKYYDRMVKLLGGRFRNLSPEEIEDVVADWFAEICIEVEESRIRAEQEGKNENLAPSEIMKRKVTYAEKCVGFGFDQSFEAWLWVVLKNKMLDYLRKKTRRGETEIDTAEDTGDRWNGVSEVEFALLIKEFKKFLLPALGEKERLYFQIWEEYGWNPGSRIVREIFQKKIPESGASDASLSLIKHRFIRISYLTFIRIEYDANLLSATFRRFIDEDEDEETFFDDMMHIIWNVFYDDDETRAESVRKISPNLWIQWEQLVQKKRKQNEILSENYRFFRTRKPRPPFCRLVELYADNAFGGRVRKLFFGSGGLKENE